MGQGVVRKDDTCTGHGCYGSRANDAASPNVNTNGRGTHRVGDHWVSHCCGPDCHDSTADKGSGTVNVNGKPIFRHGDAVACGSAGDTCSANVLAG